MSERRSYKQFCGLAKALDVVGERWTLLVVRDLLIGPRRYGDLLNGLPGITTNLLAARLKELEALGLIEKRKLPAPASSVVYQLTPMGRELEPAVMALAAWGGRFLRQPNDEDTVNIGWGLLSMKRRYRGVAAPITVNLRVDERSFHWRLAPGAIQLEEGLLAPADVTATGSAGAIRELFFLGASSDELVRAGKLKVEGSIETWQRFVDAFGPSPFAKVS